MDRTVFRLQDIQTAIKNIDDLLAEESFDSMYASPVIRAAFERFLEIISEASRHIPTELKDQHPNIRWRSIADMGNHLRHAYHKVDAEVLWNVYENELDSLKQAIDSLVIHLKK